MQPEEDRLAQGRAAVVVLAQEDQETEAARRGEWGGGEFSGKSQRFAESEA